MITLFVDLYKNIIAWLRCVSLELNQETQLTLWSKDVWYPQLATLLIGIPSVIGLYLTLRKQQRSLQKLEQRQRMDDLVTLAISLEERLMKLTVEQKFPASEEIIGKSISRQPQYAGRKFNFIVDHDKKLVRLEDQDHPLPNPEAVIPFESAIALVLWAKDEFGLNILQIRYSDRDDHFFNLRREIHSFAATYCHLVVTIEKAIELGYGNDVSAILLGSSVQASGLLKEIGALDAKIYERAESISAKGISSLSQ